MLTDCGSVYQTLVVVFVWYVSSMHLAGSREYDKYTGVFTSLIGRVFWEFCGSEPCQFISPVVHFCYFLSCMCCKRPECLCVVDRY